MAFTWLVFRRKPEWPDMAEENFQISLKDCLWNKPSMHLTTVLNGWEFRFTPALSWDSRSLSTESIAGWESLYREHKSKKALWVPLKRITAKHDGERKEDHKIAIIFEIPRRKTFGLVKLWRNINRLVVQIVYRLVLVEFTFQSRCSSFEPITSLPHYRQSHVFGWKGISGSFCR